MLTPHSFKLGGMISVEDWAEIRRLHRAEGVANQRNCPPDGDQPEYGAKALASDEPP